MGANNGTLREGKGGGRGKGGGGRGVECLRQGPDMRKTLLDQIIPN